ncbi:MAG: hypothetical protein KIT80_21465 [Chitinophagaceae bacterium]|nr:hypothetical protein [Chitinophagaceae bacterium]MCW5929504.1 hypothetical protein [Chitinophagaceae bacterium]
MKQIVTSFVLALYAAAVSGQSIPFKSTPLTDTGDISAKMVDGINTFLLSETDRLYQERATQWKKDFSSAEAFRQSVSGQRLLLTNRLGISGERTTPRLEVLTGEGLQQLVVTTDGTSIYAVRWHVQEHLTAEGILIRPQGKVKAKVVMIPDADMLPELLGGLAQPGNPGFAAALMLSEAGVEVLIPALINRETDFSGNPSLNRKTAQPHREWVYRQAYTIGRHVIGYELQKIFAALDWFSTTPPANTPLGVAGYGEGGLLALYATALDERISSTLVSGYFSKRESLWKEPIYRNVFGLLKTFGDAELAAMAWPRKIIIEAAAGPEIVHNNRGATPGMLSGPLYEMVSEEYKRAETLIPAGKSHLQLVSNGTRQSAAIFTTSSLSAFAQPLAIDYRVTKPTSVKPIAWIDNKQRQERQVREMTTKVQLELAVCERTRNQEVWKRLNEGNDAQKAAVREELRTAFGNVLGRLAAPSVPFNARARKYDESEKWISYEIMLDVYSPDVFAWGILVVPKGISAGEKRPVIVCQHGLEGLPADVVTTDSTAKNYHYYKGYATRLAEKGYITFAPHNPYRGEDKFRVIQRKANPLGLTLFSVITAQHERIVEWLQQLSFVDPGQVAMYGLSYGGKTAMRVPALVKGYALSVCSADFNEWVRKVSTTDHTFGYVYTGEYDMPEWDLGHTFNYAEMAALIAPRPFMVERGHFDGVGTDEWVNYEYAKVRRYYNLLGLSESVTIEHFPGPHSINGKGSFDFLDKHLRFKK